MNLDNWPPDLADGDLLAYIEGAADDVTRQRIDRLLAQSPELRTELTGMARLHEALASRLGSGRASSRQELGEYALGLLPPDRAAELAQQLSGDPQLRRELAELQAFLASPELSPAPESKPGVLVSLGRQVNVIVAQLVQGFANLGAGMPALAPASVRGEAGASAAYEAGAGRLVIIVQPDISRPQLRSVLGLLIDIERPESLAALLYEGDRLAAEAACDELGNFTLAGLSPQTYDLVLRGATLEVIVPDLVVR